MAESKGSSKKGNVLTRKIGPLPAWGWFGVAGGTFLVVKLISSRKAASTATTTALSGGTTVPASDSTTTDTSLPTFSSLADWEEAAISAMANGTLSPADALNGVTDWINGQCVTAEQFSGISSVIASVGLPPGFSTVPTLSVCGSAATTPAAAPSTSSAAGGDAESGSGFYNPSSQSLVGSLLGDLSGATATFTHITDPTILSSLPAGTSVFYQPEPGVFAKTTSGQQLANGTALYLQTPATVAA